MAIPAALITGTICYIILGIVALAVVFSMRSIGKLNPDDAAVGNVVVIIATVSMWLFWFCAWMHQWHPLISPIYEG
ncbi:unnamed protein product [Cylindrotheca closterium]|uniref:V-type proton ATPase subunit n=1 Tax=Cylindrotheca closterium TaxID=2856 RepID=A0AAD2PX64_9STRA|nr:unnamed protein product [Cylindrotheca closterium]